jgi:O-antigen/teichoic acid export membrane protein
MDRPKEKHASGGATLYALSRIWLQLAGGILFLVTSVRISPSEFGEFAVAASTFAALTVFVGQGTYEYVMKERDNPRAAPTVFFLNMSTATLAAVAALIAAFVIPMIIEGRNASRMLTMLAPAFYLMALSTLMESVIMKRGQITKVAVASLVTETVALVIALVALFRGAGVLALVYQRLSREAMILAAYGVTTKWRPQIDFSMAEARRAVLFAKDIVATRFIGMGSTAALDVTIAAVLSTADAGVYRLVQRLLNMGSDVIYQPFRAIMWVRLPPLQNDIKAFGRTALEVLEVYAVGLFAILVGVALIAAPAFPLVFDPEWHDVGVVVIIVAVSRLILTPGSLSEVVFALSNRTAILTRSALLLAVLSLVSAFVAAPFGLMPFLFSQIVVALISEVYVLPHIAAATGVPIREYLKMMLRLTLASLVMVALVSPWLHFGPIVGIDGWPLVGTAVLFGALAYLASARRFSPVGYAAYEDTAVSLFNRIRSRLSGGGRG